MSPRHWRNAAAWCGGGSKRPNQIVCSQVAILDDQLESKGGAGNYPFMPGRFDEPCGMFHFLRYAADSVMPALASRAGGEASTLAD